MQFYACFFSGGTPKGNGRGIRFHAVRRWKTEGMPRLVDGRDFALSRTSEPHDAVDQTGIRGESFRLPVKINRIFQSDADVATHRDRQ